MYSLLDHGRMIRDRPRMQAYAAALRRAIQPGAVVVDIGTGTGVLALLACRYGARTVYAIEASDTIEVARDVARANGLADRIRFIHDRSTDVALPEAADVIVSDLRGVLPLFERHVPSIVDARRRLLGPGGSLIPARDVVWLAVVTAPELYEPYVIPWTDNDHGLDLGVVRPLVTSGWQKCRVRPSQLLLEPRPWATLDFATVEHAAVAGGATWTAAEAGTAHGLLLWFDTELAPGVSLSNAPGAPEAIYGQAFFPLSDPVRLAPGDTVAVSLTAAPVGADYVWAWTTRVQEGRFGGPTKADLRQSTLHGVPLSPATLARRAADHVPTLTEDGRLDLVVLRALDAHVPLGRIADEVLAKFSAACPTWETALARVADLSARYGL
jgi:protein arginine N-methyltransferase 1